MQGNQPNLLYAKRKLIESTITINANIPIYLLLPTTALKYK